MITTIRNTLAFLLPLFVTTACDYVPPTEVDPAPNTGTYAPSRSVLCGNVQCIPEHVCCLDPMNFGQNKCMVESACKGIAAACDGAEDCIDDAICCGNRNMGDPAASAIACTIGCAEPDVRICHSEKNPSTCVGAVDCVPILSLPKGFGSCQSTGP